MLYVAIDQHAKQITVVMRNHQGEDVLKRQVSTRPEKIKEFFDRVVEMDVEFMAILESCGFNDWLIDELRQRNCWEIVLIHSEKPSNKKADRRDGSHLRAEERVPIARRSPQRAVPHAARLNNRNSQPPVVDGREFRSAQQLATRDIGITARS